MRDYFFDHSRRRPNMAHALDAGVSSTSSRSPGISLEGNGSVLHNPYCVLRTIIKYAKCGTDPFSTFLRL